MTYQNSGNDEGAVSQGIGDVNAFSLRHFCDVKTSRRTPFPHLWTRKTVQLSVPCLQVSYDLSRLPPHQPSTS